MAAAKKQVAAVQGINLEISSGQVYGFLGPNGAGISTTIRMILDLIRPTQGEVFIFGRAVRKHHDVLRRVGGLVEGAAFYNFLSGRKNLEVLARTGGYFDAARMQTLLEQVGMAVHADRLVKGYSTGMKQRLGLAAALLNDPDLVILDEPTNGLDPAGIQEMRHFIRHLVDMQNKTVFLSSHLLGEVEQVCDRVAIIHQGKIVRECAMVDLLNAQTRLDIEVEPLEQAVAVLQESWQILPGNGRAPNTLSVLAVREEAPVIVQQLVAHEVRVYQVHIARQSLEEYFLAATGSYQQEVNG